MPGPDRARYAFDTLGEAARAVIRFLTTPAATAVFMARGLEAG